MLLKAAQDFNIDLSQSYMVGDGENDVKAGIAAGGKVVLLSNNQNVAQIVQIDTLTSVQDFVKKYL